MLDMTASYTLMATPGYHTSLVRWLGAYLGYRL